MWAIWKARNNNIFEGKKMPVLSLLHQIVYSSQMYCPPAMKAKKSRALVSGPVLVYPCGFFDGASISNIGGVGFCLFLNESHSFEFALGAGYCTNTKAELVGLWALLHSAQVMGIPTLNVFGDSSVIINWEKGTAGLSTPNLSHWCRETRNLYTCFLKLSFSHIYHEHNQLADSLSKSALSLAPGVGSYTEIFEGLLASHDTFKLFWARCWSLFSFFSCTFFVRFGAGTFRL